jgi:hypothetical protein
MIAISNKKEPKVFYDKGNISGIMLKLFQHLDHTNKTKPINEDSPSEEQEYKKHKRYLDKEKVNFLNKHIFPSMVCLTYFFKYVSTYKTLNKTFENDVKDLLGIRVKDPESDDYAFIFADLLRSILSTEFCNKGFRLGLIHILQEIIKENVEEYVDSTQKNENIKNVILDDFDRVSAWTAILAENVDQTAEDKIQPHRTISFERRLSLYEPSESI